MKLSLNWLKNHIPEFEIADNEQFKARVDTRLSEVEHVETRGDKLHLLVVGEIMQVAAHPSSDKLVVCQVNVGMSDLVQIVCGAPNARVGLYSVAAMPGGQVYPDIKIGVREVMGVESRGMLCAMDELGLWPDHNKIIELDKSLAPGTDVTAMFKDVVLEIENKALPHRPDVFSHRGVAREISTIFKTPLIEGVFEIPQASASEDAPVNLKVEIKNDELCWRYSAITLKSVSVGPSPLWLQIALAYAGMKPINNVVDITNYVMHDIGQPMHAFDLDKLAGSEIIVREAAKGEKLITIDHAERELQPGMLVIADKNGAIAVGGVMGGVATEVTETTQNIVLEAANFEMYSIRRTSRRLGLRSEAVTRYEKGVDPELTTVGLALACQMLQDICGAEISSEITDNYPNPQPQKVIDLDLLSVRRSLGVDIDKSRIVQTLENLGFTIGGLEKLPSGIISRQDISTPVQVLVPSFRRDINAEYDLLEEVGRIFGYEHIPVTAPKRDLNIPAYNRFTHISQKAKAALANGGLQEVLTYSMVGERIHQPFGLKTDDLIALMQPISDELAFVRNLLLPSLLDKTQLNLAQSTDFGLFELSRVAIKTKDLLKDIPPQPYKLAGMRIGKDAATTYGKLKYALDLLAASLKQQLVIKAVTAEDTRQIPAYFHPKQVAGIYLDQELLGFSGNLHPSVLHKADLDSYAVAAFELNFDSIVGLELGKTALRDISNYPMVMRDISFWQKPESYYSEILSVIQQLKLPELVSIELSDRYTDKEQNRVSLTMSLKLQGADRTLTQAEINDLLTKVSGALTSTGHSLR